MVACSVHNTVVSVDLRVRQQRWHSEVSILLGHFHRLSNYYEDQKHTVDLVLVARSVVMTVPRIVCKIYALTIITFSAESHVKTFLACVYFVWCH